ncbi:MAG: MXAN_5187 C-terminal domain-containing protein [Polyangiales bacterium]
MDQRQYEASLADAEIRLRRLRMLYDQWFHGLERAEPRVQRAEVDKLVAALRRAPQRNTALRFRFNQLVQRYTTYNTYWQRITRQIEEGTYKRDVLRARRRFGADGEQDRGANANGYELDLDIDIEAALETAGSQPPLRATSHPPPADDRPLRAAREITPFAQPADMLSGAPRPPSAPPRVVLPRPSGKPPPVPLPKAPPPAGLGAPRSAPSAKQKGVSDEQIQGIYQRYLDARRQNQERTDNVKLESVAKTVRDMLPKLEQKHGGKQIDFEVVVRDGRVALKPVAK